MNGAVIVDLAVIFFAILVLVSIANRLHVPYPIVLVLGGMALGYIPGLPPLAMPPNLVLVIFLPPLLYWESVTAPISEFFSPSGRLWILQLAVGLVIVTMVALAAVAHALIKTLPLGAALVLGAINSSTDEVAFGAIGERIRIPRHVTATIEGESLINDATSLVLYGIGIAAVVSGSFSFPHAVADLAISAVGAVAIGVSVGLLSSAAWSLTKEDNALQGLISVVTPYLSYIPAYYLGISGVLAVVATGITVSYFTPRVLTPETRDRMGGFWVTIVFTVNAFIFVLVGLQFHHIVSTFHRLPWTQLAWYGLATSLTVILVRLVWVFAQGLLPQTNEPEHVQGKADWSHVMVLAWTGMRGGISLAAALAIPLETAAGPFPERNLIIFLTFCVLLATLVIQGGTLPLIVRWLNVRDDGTDEREERIALAQTAKAALKRLDELARGNNIPPGLLRFIRGRFATRWSEFAAHDHTSDAAREGELYRKIMCELIEAQRAKLLELARKGQVDNTVLRRVQRLLDLEMMQLNLGETVGQSDLDVEQ